MRFKSNLSRIFMLSLSILTVLAAFSCSKEESVTGPEESTAYLWVHLLGDSAKVLFEGLATIDADGEEAIPLSEFISTSLIPLFDGTHDARVLYAYRMVGDDGFSASVKGYPDNTWVEMQLGHIMKATRNVVFPDDLIDLPGAYNVKEASHIYVYRKFDVYTPDTTLFYELKDMTVEQIDNFEGQPEDAVSLAEFADLAVADPENYQYNIVGVDGFGPSGNMTWQEFETGYWLLVTEKTIFTDPGLSGGAYKLKALERIEIE